MKLLEFIVILGIFLKGHYVSAIKLSSNYHNRKLLIKDGAAEEGSAFVYFGTACTVTRLSAEKIAADTATCGASIEFCDAPGEESKCETPTKVSGGSDVQGISVFDSPGEGAPETTTEFKDCTAVGFAKDEKTLEAKTNAPVAVTEDGDELTITATEDKGTICPGDNGGAIVCGGKLAGIIKGADASCAAAAKGVKVAALLSGAGGDGSAAPAEEGDSSTTAPGGGGGAYAITPSLAITTLPIIIITYLDH